MSCARAADAKAPGVNSVGLFEQEKVHVLSLTARM